MHLSHHSFPKTSSRCPCLCVKLRTWKSPSLSRPQTRRFPCACGIALPTLRLDTLYGRCCTTGESLQRVMLARLLVLLFSSPLQMSQPSGQHEKLCPCGQPGEDHVPLPGQEVWCEDLCICGPTHRPSQHGGGRTTRCFQIQKWSLLQLWLCLFQIYFYCWVEICTNDAACAQQCTIICEWIALWWLIGTLTEENTPRSSLHSIQWGQAETRGGAWVQRGRAGVSWSTAAGTWHSTRGYSSSKTKCE